MNISFGNSVKFGLFPEKGDKVVVRGTGGIGKELETGTVKKNTPGSRTVVVTMDSSRRDTFQPISDLV